METFTLSGIQSMLGLSRAVITGLIAAGFVTPSRGKRREYRFSFQDVVLLRTAHGLQAAKIPPRKILRSLRTVRAALPDELPLTGLRIAAVGSQVAVRDGNAQWDVESGQLLFDFEVKPAAGSVSVLGAAPAAEDALERAVECFNHALAFETHGQSDAAEAAYRDAIRLAPDYVDPVLNLGVLLCDAGRGGDAVVLCREGLRHHPDEALLHFNMAVACEDIGRLDDALAAYETCLRLAPTMADAHYNAARLHEQLGHASKAIRHYNAYRRLQT